MEPTIQTVSGNYFNFLHPHPDQFDIYDIAHALAHVCRFGGHTDHFYSVAQHSVLVSQAVPPEDALAGLLHDAAEAFLGDVPTPLKMLLPDFKEIERKVEEVVFESLGISAELPPSVKKADLEVLAAEKRDLLKVSNHQWAVLQDVEPFHMEIHPMPPSFAKRYFIDRYKVLTQGAA